MPTFTPADRLAITRRQLNIPKENAAYAKTTATMTSDQAKLLAVEHANEQFYNDFNLLVQSYENEARAASGTIPATYTEGTIDPFTAGDVSTSAQSPGSAGAVFFPASYTFFIPFIINAVNGYLHPTGTDAQYELNILDNAVVEQGLVELIFRLQNGITGVVSATTTITANIPAGPITNFTVSVGNANNFSPGDKIYATNSPASGIYQIVSIFGANSISISSVIPSYMGIAAGANAQNTVVAFSAAELQTLTSPSYQEILTTITNDILILMNAWESKLVTQISNLTANTDTRSPQTTQNATALSNANAAKSVIDAWLALSPTGVNGRYVPTNIAPISSEITTRQAFIPTRISQIITALGSVAQSQNTFSGVVGSPYYNRYLWLDIRINRVSGSATRYFAASSGISYLNTLTVNNNEVKDQYDAYFTTKAITSIDATAIVQISDLTGLNVGDAITVVSETQAEIPRAIIKILGTTQLQLDLPIPNTYLIKDLARVFKTL